MPMINEDKDRRVIPRWRSPMRALATGEVLRRDFVRPPLPSVEPSLERLQEEFSEQRSIAIAADLLSAGVAAGRTNEVKDAARFIIDSDFQIGTSLASLLRFVIDENSQPHPDLVENGELPAGMVFRQTASDVAAAKVAVRNNPRNGLVWTELARLYTALGCHKQAEKSLAIALQLFPDDRYILRAASRFFIHSGDFERAHGVLISSPRTNVDPWLLAAEVAIASAIDMTPRLIKKGKRLLDQKKHLPFDTSELNSAIGTVFIESGNRRRGRQLVEDSLGDPTENCIAQAAWVNRNLTPLKVPTQSAIQSFEASAWDFSKQEEWKSAHSESLKWLSDQPFSSRPAVFASHTAAVALTDFEASADAARLGLIANPMDFTLLNNLAFACAQCDNVVEAEQQLAKISKSGLAESDRIVLNATSGLVQFRSGNADMGRQLYKVAIEDAQRLKLPRYVMNCSVWLTLEELRISSGHSKRFAEQALLASEAMNIPELAKPLDRIREQIAKR